MSSVSSRPRVRKRHQTKTKDVSAVDVVEDEKGRGKPRQRDTDIYVNPKHYQTAKDKARLLEELNEYRHMDSYCQLRSEEGVVYHAHFSTQYMRYFRKKYRSTDTYHCPICKQEEPIHLP